MLHNHKGCLTSIFDTCGLHVKVLGLPKMYKVFHCLLHTKLTTPQIITAPGYLVSNSCAIFKKPAHSYLLIFLLNLVLADVFLLKRSQSMRCLWRFKNLSSNIHQALFLYHWRQEFVLLQYKPFVSNGHVHRKSDDLFQHLDFFGDSSHWISEWSSSIIFWTRWINCGVHRVLKLFQLKQSH